MLTTMTKFNGKCYDHDTNMVAMDWRMDGLSVYRMEYLSQMLVLLYNPVQFC